MDWLSRTRKTPFVWTFSKISFVSSLDNGPKYQLKKEIKDFFSNFRKSVTVWWNFEKISRVLLKIGSKILKTVTYCHVIFIYKNVPSYLFTHRSPFCSCLIWLIHNIFSNSLSKCEWHTCILYSQEK